MVVFWTYILTNGQAQQKKTKMHRRFTSKLRGQCHALLNNSCFTSVCASGNNKVRQVTSPLLTSLSSPLVLCNTNTVRRNITYKKKTADQQVHYAPEAVEPKLDKDPNVKAAVPAGMLLRNVVFETNPLFVCSWSD